jgi:hypothetical protein
MYPNINSGIGQLMSRQLALNPTTGRIFIVCKASLTTIKPEIDAMYGNGYPDGVPIVYTTVQAAKAACVANRGDIILIAPGHTETISNATTLTMTVAGVTIIGLGVGSLRPTFTFDTATTANIPVTAANVTIKNCIFIANFADIVSCFTNNAAPEFVVEDCAFRDTSSVLNFLAIITTTVSVNADGLKFNRNRLKILGTTAATTPIKVAGTMDRIQINDNYVTKAVLNNTSCLLAHAALVVTNLEMGGNLIFSANTDSSSGGFLITTSSTTNSGMVYNNKVQGLDVAAAILVTAGCKYGMFNNLYDGDADASGFVLPAIGSDS